VRVRRFLFLALAAVLVAIGLISQRSTAAHREVPADPPRTAAEPVTPLPAGTILATVRPAAYGRTIPAGFVGLSFEYPALEAYAGRNPNAINPVLERLIRDLAPGQSPVLRIGGDSTDWTWWPVRQIRRPLGISYALDKRWLRVARALSQALHASLILGINLEAGSQTLAGAEARALVDGIGRSRIGWLELGNEPELYAAFGWYRTRDGRHIPGRPRSWGVAPYVRQFADFGKTLPRVPLAGPAVGAQGWMHHLGQFVSNEPRLGLVSLHRYPLHRCFVNPRSSGTATIPHLLSSAAASGLARSVRPYVAIAHARGLHLRIDELNSVSCGGSRRVSNSFASALWALDTLFQMASVGVDGVNIHTFPLSFYAPFKFTRRGGRWRALVQPEYYGLMMFAHAAPPGSRLLPVSGATGGKVKLWATRAPGGQTRVVLINENTAGTRAVAVQVPGSTGVATVQRLRAPSIDASRGVALAGQSFGSETGTGLVSGRRHATRLAPVSGRYLITLPAASAAIVTLAKP
jgi:Glycosyl hydrolase family 79 C-terminal beta domain